VYRHSRSAASPEILKNFREKYSDCVTCWERRKSSAAAFCV
jgi:hypothetical protein